MLHEPNDTRSKRDLANALAAKASADPRTVAKYLSGRRVRRCVEERIDQAAKAMGVRFDPEDAALAK